MSSNAPKPFTGRHMFAILAAFFGVVIAVNVTMASYATSTFGGVVVENSYVASQEFNRWLAEAEAARALGWSADAIRREDGRIEVTVTGAPPGARLSATARHPLGRMPDETLTFESIGAGSFVSNERLARGRWTLRLEVEAGGRAWRHEEPIR